jgi:protein SCO1/2
MLVALAACGADRGPGSAATSDSAESSAGQRYQLVGVVVASSRDQGTITLDHEAVADFMGAMTMPFNVRDDWVFDAAVADARVTATLVVDGRSSWLEDVVVRRPAAAGAAAAAVIPAPDPGALVPSIALLDQTGASLALAAYGGSYYVYTFIYTRCPLPDFCPRMSENMDAIYDAVVAEPVRYGDLKLLSISIDPEYDTPDVLTAYGERYLEDDAPAGFARWRFATSDAAGLHDLGEFSGIRFRPDSSEFVHSLRTVLVDQDGRVIEAYIGNTWEPEDLLATLAAAVAERP